MRGVYSVWSNKLNIMQNRDMGSKAVSFYYGRLKCLPSEWSSKDHAHSPGWQNLEPFIRIVGLNLENSRGTEKTDQ